MLCNLVDDNLKNDYETGSRFYVKSQNGFTNSVPKVNFNFNLRNDCKSVPSVLM